MRSARLSGIKSARNAVAAAAEVPVLWRLHQSDNTARSFGATSPVAPGYPTVITLGGASTSMAGGWATISDVVGMTELNGTWRVLWRGAGNTIALDVDSGAFSPWVSGGTLTPTVIQDEFQQAPAMQIQGTVTGVWGNPMFGLTAHSGGSNSLRQTAGIDAFDLSGFRGRLVVGCGLWINAAPSGDEGVFSVGVNSASGAGTAAGAVTINLEASRELKFMVRPASATDGAGSNNFAYSGALTLQTSYKVALIVDFDGFPATGESHIVLDGAHVRSYAMTMTGATDAPGIAAGMAIGARIGNGPSYAIGGLMGSLGSGLRLQELLWWKTSKSLTDTMRAVQAWHRAGSLRLMA